MDLNENEKIIRFNKDNIYLRSLHKTEFKLLPYYHDISVGKYDIGSSENSWDNVFSKVVNAGAVNTGPITLTAAGTNNTTCNNANGINIPEILKMSGNNLHLLGIYTAKEIYIRFNCGASLNNLGNGLVLNATGSTLSSPLAVANAVTATSFIKSGSDNTKVLLGGGGDKALSDFAMSADLSKYAKRLNLIIPAGSTYVFRTSGQSMLVMSRRNIGGASKVFTWTGYGVDYSRNNISIIDDRDPLIELYLLHVQGFAIKNNATSGVHLIYIYSSSDVTYLVYDETTHGALYSYNVQSIWRELPKYVLIKQLKPGGTANICYNNVAQQYIASGYNCFRITIPNARKNYCMYGFYINLRTYYPFKAVSMIISATHSNDSPYVWRDLHVLYNSLDTKASTRSGDNRIFRVFAETNPDQDNDVIYILANVLTTISINLILVSDAITKSDISNITIDGITQSDIPDESELTEFQIHKSAYMQDLIGSNVLLTGYAKSSSVNSIDATDTLNTALGKLEYKVDDVRTKVLSIDLLLNVANPSDTTVDRLIEVFNVLSGINDTDTIQSIIGKYLPLTGGTLVGDLISTGDIIASSSTVHDRSNNVSMFINKTSIYNKPIARHTYAIKMGENTLFNVGYYIDNSSLQYVYMGVQNSYSHQNNFRIYPDHVQSNAFVKNGSDENHVLLGNGDHKALTDFDGAWFINRSTIDLTDRRTIGGLKEALSEFVAANLSKMEATGMCSFRVDTMVNRWNNTQGLDAAEVDTQGLDPGGNVQFTIISPHNTSDYALLRMTTYLNNEVYYICLYGRTWQKIYRSAAVLTSHLPIGSVTRPVYVNENGAIQPCNDKLDVNISKPVLIKMDNDTSNCKSSVDFFASNGTTKLASICYFNKTNRILLNVGNLTSLWYEDVLKSTLSIGTDDVRYRGYPMLHTGNIDAYNLYTFEKTIHITQDWQDTGILYNDLPSSGTYAVLVYINNDANNINYGYYSGIMSWWAGGNTNLGLTDEIMLHKAGYFTGARIFLRTLEVSNSGADAGNNYMRLQIASHKEFVGDTTVQFKFRKLI